MKANQTTISLKEMRTFYKEECENEETKFSEKEFSEFMKCCERDFYQWLKDNLKFFKSETNRTAITNTTE